jgi:hypothetical protein
MIELSKNCIISVASQIFISLQSISVLNICLVKLSTHILRSCKVKHSDIVVILQIMLPIYSIAHLHAKKSWSPDHWKWLDLNELNLDKISFSCEKNNNWFPVK